VARGAEHFEGFAVEEDVLDPVRFDRRGVEGVAAAADPDQNSSDGIGSWAIVSIGTPIGGALSASVTVTTSVPRAPLGSVADSRSR
jgi:hypothetical protein